MNALREWFYGLEARERMAVIAGTVAVLFALFYYALWKPLNAHLADARAQVTAESNQTRWMLGIRDEARLLQSSGQQHEIKGRGDSLLSIVDQTSRDNDLGGAVRHIQPASDNKAIVSLEDANFNQLLVWLQSLQADYGVTARDLTLNRQEDKPGMVDARLTLIRSGA